LIKLVDLCPRKDKANSAKEMAVSKGLPATVDQCTAELGCTSKKVKRSVIVILKYIIYLKMRARKGNKQRKN